MLTLCRGSSGNVGQNSCEVGIDMGTSMATPIVAGAAILVRQYFEDGWYPNGSPVSQFGFNPSAPLVKAVMLGATACSRCGSNVS
jgi:Subtilase family